MTIAEVNRLNAADFIQAFGWVFEDSPWVAERGWCYRPFADVEELHRALVDVVEHATRKEQLALIRAHPDLGTRARISAASSEEQTGAGLDRLTPAEFELFTRLNHEYREKFGFPFLFAVRGSGKYDVLRALEQRLESAMDAEFREALRQVYRIAEFRLRDTVT